MKAIKIRIKDEDHAKEVQDHLFSLGYEWKGGGETYFIGKIDVITAYEEKDGKYIYFCNTDWCDDGGFTLTENQEVELVTELKGGVISTYLKEVSVPLKETLNDDTEKKYMAFAMGYADGKDRRGLELTGIFNSDEEKSLYDKGYEKGLIDFYYDLNHGMFED